MEVSNFDIDQIMRSGQCFRISEIEPGKYSVIHLDKYLEIEVEEGGRYLLQCSKEDLRTIWAPYFDLKSDVYTRAAGLVVPDDEFLNAAVEYGSGIRILNQDLWEVMVQFITSQRNNIPRIKKTISNLCELYGTGHELSDGRLFYSIPTPEQMAEADLEGLKETGLYYRAEYVQQLAKKIVAGEISLRFLKESMNFERSHNILLSIKGIGPKVAACIELFGMHHLQALPVDTWMSKIIQQIYDGYFPAHLYTGYEGLMQQYMFFYALDHKEEFAEEVKL